MSGLIDDPVIAPINVEMTIHLAGEADEAEAASITAALQNSLRSWLEESIFPFRVRGVEIVLAEPDPELDDG